MKRVSEGGFSYSMGDLQVRAEKASLKIEDGRAGVKDSGVPNGYVDGEVSASGDIELDAANMSILGEVASSAGSWQQIGTTDMLWYCKGTKEEQKIEAFGCLLSLEDIVNYDPSSNKKALTKIRFEITDPDFVKINGVPYLDPARTEGIVSDG